MLDDRRVRRGVDCDGLVTRQAEAVGKSEMELAIDVPLASRAEFRRFERAD
jgi:hypothetical protein